ncbi:MAG TPA: molybdate ABC transporter substrate-binding protein [Nocardioides sp.]|nr:molybdate ABC transporter substrate-binding protein [Nocardioides sp.]
MNSGSRRVAAFMTVVLTLPLTACGDDSGGGRHRDQTLTVFAAASLAGVFGELEETFEADHPGVDVKLSLGGSSDLVAQITEGAQADVFASADTTTMAQLTAAHLADGDPVEMATNTLEIAVPPGNPAQVAGLRDLARDGLDLVLCAPEVPCGKAAHSLAAAAKVSLHPVSEEQSVTDVLAKVEAGEADAGLVYVTDVRAAGDEVDGVEVPEAASVVNHYPIVAVSGSGHHDLARDWLDLVTGPGQQVLERAGFGPPSS